MTDNEKYLIEEINKFGNWDAIVVEGYDGVGKGRVLEVLSEYYQVKPYRPDYNLWQMFDHRKEDRWKISGFFWDVFSHFHNSSGARTMLFDRGVLSGAVYNHDMRIASMYKNILRDMKVLHILVECNSTDYYKFMKSRNNNISQREYEDAYEKYKYYNNLYNDALILSQVDYIIYNNKYDSSLSDRLCLCKGCGHYSYGICRHPKVNESVDGEQLRCEYSNDKEVQDRDDSQVYSLQS